MLPRPPRKTRKGARSEARGRRPNAPFLVFLMGSGVASQWVVTVMSGYSYEWSQLWVVTFMSGHSYEWSQLWVVTVMSGHSYGWSQLWVVTVMSGHSYEWSQLWVVTVMSGHSYEWSQLWVVTVMSGHSYEWSQLWVVKVMSGHSYELCILGGRHFGRTAWPAGGWPWNLSGPVGPDLICFLHNFQHYFQIWLKFPQIWIIMPCFPQN